MCWVLFFFFPGLAREPKNPLSAQLDEELFRRLPGGERSLLCLPQDGHVEGQEDPTWLMGQHSCLRAGWRTRLAATGPSC